MHRPEGVLDEEIVVIGELSGEPRIVLRLARVEARVLEHAKTVVGQVLPQALCHWSDRERRVFSLGATEMRADRDLTCLALRGAIAAWATTP